MRQAEWSDPLPRELVAEINTSRESKPIFWPGRYHPIDRPLLTAAVEPLLRELGSMDDARLSIGGVGDPLASPHFFNILDVAQSSDIGAIAVETDFLTERGEDVARLARSSVDAVSVFLPATTVETYAQVMGVDGYARVLENIRIFLAERQQRNRGLPLLVPIFVKCRENLGEMEAWYDQWLRIPRMRGHSWPKHVRRRCARCVSRGDGSAFAPSMYTTRFAHQHVERRPPGFLRRRCVGTTGDGPARKRLASRSLAEVGASTAPIA